MNFTTCFRPRFLFSWVFAMAALWTGAGTSLHAAVGAVSQVSYSPTIKEVQGQLPYGATYVMEVQAPANLSSAVTVTFEKKVNGFLPAGASEATALSYVQFTPSQLQFTSGGQKQYVTVSFQVPNSAVPGAYGYQIRTLGWPVDLGATNVGSSINATVSLLSLPQPPTVTIRTPVDTTPADPYIIINRPTESLPITIPVEFVADAPGSNPASVITSVDGDVNGAPLTNITTQGLNSLYVIGTAAFTATQYGTYTVRVRATNSAGTDDDTSTIVIAVRRPKTPLTVIAENKTKVYGEVNPALTYRIEGFVEGETLATSGVTGIPAITLAPGVGVTSPVIPGGYPITAAIGTLASENYTFEFVAGTLTISKANLLFVARNKSRLVNQPNPILDYDTVGLKNSDTVTQALNGGSIALSTTATEQSSAGPYPIIFDNASTLQSTNYTLSFQPGTLTIEGVPTAAVLSGTVFLDVDRDGVHDKLATGPIEPGLPGIVVQLFQGSSSTPIASTTASATGEFSFTVPAGNYTVDVLEPVGLTPTTMLPLAATAPTSNLQIGLWLDFTKIATLRGDGHSQGYWKSNVGKAKDGKTGGVQESLATIVSLTNQIRTLALPVFSEFRVASTASPATLADPLAVFNSKDQLRLQLLAAEYNYTRGYLLNSSVALTHAFVTWGEFVATYGTTSEKSTAQKWLDAFNNTYGGVMGSVR